MNEIDYWRALVERWRVYQCLEKRRELIGGH